MPCVAVLCGLLGSAALAPVPTRGCADDRARVLILTSQRRDFGSSAAAEDRFVDSLRAGLNGCLDDHVEHVDAARTGDTDYLQSVRDFLAQKYRGIRFDLVITLQWPALAVIERFGPSLFPGTPVFFVAGKGLENESENTSPGPNDAGVLYNVDLRPTVSIAMALQPRLKRIVVVSGGSPFDKTNEQGARDQFRALEKRVEFSYLSGRTLDELHADVSRLPSDAAVFLLSVGSDRFGNKFIRSSVAASLSAAASVPVYSCYGVFMGRGIVGGSLISLDRVLAQAAPRAVSVLRGRSLTEVGVVEVDAAELLFDARQLRRWNLSTSQLPSGSRVLYRDPEMWEEHRGFAIGLLAFSAIQAVLIVGLLQQRRHRRQVATRARSS